jgi:exopolysaccharide production protein ExoZ
MLFHANFSRASTWPFDERFGYLGVAVFFAISGMLMADILPRTEPWRFLSHRIVRIYPLYLLLVATWAVIGPATGAQKVAFHLLTLTLAPVGHRPVFLGPEWTLIYECSYYVALFALALGGVCLPTPLLLGLKHAFNSSTDQCGGKRRVSISSSANFIRRKIP